MLQEEILKIRKLNSETYKRDYFGSLSFIMSKTRRKIYWKIIL